jgi:hypothetical protein
MDGSPGRKGSSGWRAATPLVAVAASLLAADSGAQVAVGRIGLRDPQQKHAVVKAIEGAARRLARTECQGLLDEFADASGRPLRAVLEDMDASAPEYLGWVLFHDADPGTCPGPTLVHTTAGSRVVRVCGRKFERAVSQNASHAEAAIIHEMLHSLGLGENPPSSHHITQRVLNRCGS